MNIEKEVTTGLETPKADIFSENSKVTEVETPVPVSENVSKDTKEQKDPFWDEKQKIMKANTVKLKYTGNARVAVAGLGEFSHNQERTVDKGIAIAFCDEKSKKLGWIVNIS